MCSSKCFFFLSTYWSMDSISLKRASWSFLKSRIFPQIWQLTRQNPFIHLPYVFLLTLVLVLASLTFNFSIIFAKILISKHLGFRKSGAKHIHLINYRTLTISPLSISLLTSSFSPEDKINRFVLSPHQLINGLYLIINLTFNNAKKALCKGLANFL